MSHKERGENLWAYSIGPSRKSKEKLDIVERLFQSNSLTETRKPVVYCLHTCTLMMETAVLCAIIVVMLVFNDIDEQESNVESVDGKTIPNYSCVEYSQDCHMSKFSGFLSVLSRLKGGKVRKTFQAIQKERTLVEHPNQYFQSFLFQSNTPYFRCVGLLTVFM